MTKTIFIAGLPFGSNVTASKALNALKAAGLVKDRRDANWIYYRHGREEIQEVPSQSHGSMLAKSGWLLHSFLEIGDSAQPSE